MNLPTPPPETDGPEFDLAAFCADPLIRGAASAKIMILRGPIYAEDATWVSLLRYRGEVVRFLAEVGARLVLNEHDGYAFADQAPEGEPGAEWPKLFYRDRFSFDVTCVLLVLREWLLKRESIPSDEHTPLIEDDLVVELRRFSKKTNANAEKEDARWRTAINRAKDYGLLKKIPGDERSYVVRPIVRAKLSLEILHELKTTLERHATGGQSGEESPAASNDESTAPDETRESDPASNNQETTQP